VILLLAPIGFKLGRSATAAAAQTAPPEIEIPRQWIPFTALLTKIDDGNEQSAGRLYRGADGSQRLETGPSLSDIRVISIKNVTKSKAYNMAGGIWIEHPMSLPPAGWHPPRVLLNSPTYKRYQYKLALAKGQDGSLTSTVGFDAYFREANGATQLMVPALNFFPVFRKTAHGGSMVFHDIVLTENPPAALFEPPADAAVGVDPRPAGIVY
jgi:hypothetical protein